MYFNPTLYECRHQGLSLTIMIIYLKISQENNLELIPTNSNDTENLYSSHDTILLMYELNKIT